MTPQGLEKLKELEREMRKLRNETEEVHGQLRDLLWNEEENNQQLDNEQDDDRKRTIEPKGASD